MVCRMNTFSILICIAVVFDYAVLISGYKFSQFINNLEDIRMHSREKRDTNLNHLALECTDSESQTCRTLTRGTCTCECNPGYYQVKDSVGKHSACTRVKTFGGKIIFTEQYQSTNYDETKNTVTAELLSIFDEGYFLQINYVKLTRGSTIATYELSYQNHKDVNKSYVTNQFDSKYNCSYPSNVVVSPIPDALNLTINLAESCQTIVDQSVICDHSHGNYCDPISTSCVADTYGYVSCPCKDFFYQIPGNSTACIPQTCTSDSKCNSPFGSCVQVPGGVNHCSCFWGFSGVDCSEPWQFTLTVVACGCGLIIIILALVVIVQSRKTSRLESQTITRVPYNAPDTDLKYGLSDFQPGAMRAKVPPINNNNQLTINDELKAKHASRSIASKAEMNGLGNGHTNPAYKSSLQNLSSFKPSNKSPRDRDPSDYF